MKGMNFQWKGIAVVFLFLMLSAKAFAQTNVVSDAVEFQVLKDLWDSTAGSGWTAKMNWPTSGNWPSNATSAQFARSYWI